MPKASTNPDSMIVIEYCGNGDPCWECRRPRAGSARHDPERRQRWNQAPLEFTQSMRPREPREHHRTADRTPCLASRQPSFHPTIGMRIEMLDFYYPQCKVEKAQRCCSAVTTCCRLANRFWCHQCSMTATGLAADFRMGPQCDAELFTETSGFFTSSEVLDGIDELLIDECQFLTAVQVKQIRQELARSAGLACLATACALTSRVTLSRALLR